MREIRGNQAFLDRLARVILAASGIGHANGENVGPKVCRRPVAPPGQNADQADAGRERQEGLRADRGGIAVRHKQPECPGHVEQGLRHRQRRCLPLGLLADLLAQEWPAGRLDIGPFRLGQAAGVMQRFGHRPWLAHSAAELLFQRPVGRPRVAACRMDVSHRGLQIGPCRALVQFAGRDQAADRPCLLGQRVMLGAVCRRSDGVACTGERRQAVGSASVQPRWAGDGRPRGGRRRRRQGFDKPRRHLNRVEALGPGVAR